MIPLKIAWKLIRNFEIFALFLVEGFLLDLLLLPPFRLFRFVSFKKTVSVQGAKQRPFAYSFAISYLLCFSSGLRVYLQKHWVKCNGLNAMVFRINTLNLFNWSILSQKGIHRRYSGCLVLTSWIFSMLRLWTWLHSFTYLPCLDLSFSCVQQLINFQKHLPTIFGQFVDECHRMSKFPMDIPSVYLYLSTWDFKLWRLQTRVHKDWRFNISLPWLMCLVFSFIFYFCRIYQMVRNATGILPKIV